MRFQNNRRGDIDGANGRLLDWSCNELEDVRENVIDNVTIDDNLKLRGLVDIPYTRVADVNACSE